MADARQSFLLRLHSVGCKHVKSFRVTLAAGAFLLVVLFTNALISREANWSAPELASELLWKNASVRPPLLLILVFAGWGWVVLVCRASALNLEAVLGEPIEPAAATIHSALILWVLWLVVHVTHVIVSKTPGLTWRPFLTCNLSLHVIFAVLGMLPLSVLQRGSRISLGRTLFESVIAPFAPVTFWHVIVADYLTSLAKALSDIQMTSCISTNIVFLQREANVEHIRSAELWTRYHDRCTDSYANMVALALPFWWRLMQCLQVYSQTKEQKNLWNALKYSTAFPLVYAGYIKNQAPSRQNQSLFIAAAVIQSTFTFVWDVLMDWGLPQRTASGSSSVRRIPIYHEFAMRDRLIVSQRKHVYVGLCIVNLLLRFSWTLAAFGGVSSHGAGMFFFEVIEVFRRTVWAVFRIEWEVIAKGIPTIDTKYHDRRNVVATELAEITPLDRKSVV